MQSVLSVSSMAGVHLDQGDTKLVVLFDDLLEHGQVALKSKIVGE